MSATLLAVLFANISSLLYKCDLVCSLIDDNESNILVLTETWLNPDINDDEILPQTLSYIYSKDQRGIRGGGVLLSISKSLPSFVIDLIHL